MMKRYALSLTCWSLLILSGMARVEAAGAQPAERPNIVVLFADDLGYGDLSSYGHPTIRTTELDRLAREGMRLTSFYAGAPSCTPSRASLLTGRYAVRMDLPRALMPDAENGLPASEVTLAEALRAEGYRTMAVGKWHLGHAREAYLPTANGFDAYFGLLYSNDMIEPWVQTDAPLRLYRNTEPVEHPVDQSTLTVRYTEEAVQFIEEAGGAPFFLYLAYSMPHLPLHAAEAFRGQSRAGLYGDVIEAIDWSAGRVLEALETRGLTENTLVVFTSDNGPWLDPGARMLQGGVHPWHVGSPGPLRGAKGMTYEGGVRVPALIRWPARIPAGQTSAAVATTMDLYVTLIEAAGGEVPTGRPIDGHSLLPLLEGATEASPTEVLYYFNGAVLEGIREGAWKLRIAPQTWDGRRTPWPEGVPVPELFNLEVDPAERVNVAGEHPDRVRCLRQRMERFAEEVGAETSFAQQ